MDPKEEAAPVAPPTHNYVTISFPPDGDVSIGGNATVVQMLAASILLKRAATGMLDQAEIAQHQARRSLLAPLNGGRKS